MNGRSVRQTCHCLVLILALCPTTWQVAFAEIPQLMQYQGKATDKAGFPISGTHEITFRIYDAVTDGSMEWEETHTAVPIENGLFSVLLGGVTPLDLPFDEPYWLSIEIDADGEMTPRHQLTSVPYSYAASRAAQATLAAEAIHAATADALVTSPIPSGVIVMWSGSIADIPDGWALCDGTNGTPDLRDAFVVGARQDDGGTAKTNITGSLTQSGGNTSHNHNGSTGPGIAMGGPGAGQGGESTHYHTYTTGTSNHIPPYFALAYIMKL